MGNSDWTLPEMYSGSHQTFNGVLITSASRFMVSSDLWVENRTMKRGKNEAVQIRIQNPAKHLRWCVW